MRRYLAPAMAGLGLLAVVVLAAAGVLHAPDWRLLAAQPPVIQLHVAAAAMALALGGVLMARRKGVAFHRVAGWVWVVAMALVAGSSLFIVGVNGDRWSFIHLITGWTLIALPIGVVAARRHVVKTHRRFMMGLFYGGLVIAGAFTFLPGRTMWNVFFG